MTKYFLALVALAAVAATTARSYGGGASSASGQVAYQLVSVPAPVPSNGGGYGGGASSGYGAAGAGGYGGASAAPSVVDLSPIIINPQSIVSSGGAAGVLSAVNSNPSANANAASWSAGLNAGQYTLLVVPSYSVVSGVPGDSGNDDNSGYPQPQPSRY